MFQGRKLVSETNAEKLARELAKEHARRKKQQLRSILLQMNLYYRRVRMNVEASHQSLVEVFVYLCKLCARSTMIEDERQPPLPAGRRRLRRESPSRGRFVHATQRSSSAQQRSETRKRTLSRRYRAYRHGRRRSAPCRGSRGATMSCRSCQYGGVGARGGSLTRRLPVVYVRSGLLRRLRVFLLGPLDQRDQLRE
jgi:hypothetical protein